MVIMIEKYNEVFIRVFSDSSVEQELSDFFKFRPVGFQFTPKFRNKLWDGWLRLYNLNTKMLYCGLLDYVLEFANKNGYDVEFINDVYEYTDMSIEDVRLMADGMRLQNNGKDITAHNNQIEAVHKAITTNRTLLISPTSSGKSLILYILLRWHLANKRRCIIIVPSTQLVEQLYSDFIDYSSLNEFPIHNHCQRLYTGFSKHFTSDCLITTWQSIVNMKKPFFSQFDVAFGDEAHHFKAKSMVDIMENLSKVKYRIGTTGTLDGSKVNKLVLEGLFGREFKVITTKQLMDEGKVSDLKIKCLMLKYDQSTRKLLKKAEYKDEMVWLVSNEYRNKFIRNLSVSTTGNTLVLFQFVSAHGEKLYKMIQNKAGDRKVYFIHGGVSPQEREYVRKLCQSESNVIIVASYGVFSTGINMPSIENIIFASPYKSKIKVLQSIGRGLRLNEGKDHCKVFDISDDLSIDSWQNHTLKHAMERFKLYTNEQFDIKLLEVKIND